MTIGGITVRHASMAEMSNALLAIRKSRAKLAVLSGLQHALTEIGTFVQSGSESLELKQETEEVHYEVALKRPDAQETQKFDPLVSQLGAKEGIVVLEIVGYSGSKRSVEHKVTAVIDPADGGNILLWIPQRGKD
jgi:hypothetical protein